ncbi:hypothetical protein MUO98_04470 [Candidatus Bathyarchaeota archaeon]|nr:hypothetical protein [Candidatus Bathyarchaeota archaeon]
MTVSDTCKWIRNGEIDIYERDRSFMGDDILVSGITIKDGAFKIGWKAKQHDWLDDTVEVYVRFKGTEKHHPSKTYT